MATFEISANNSLYYEYTEATASPAITFVFFNALTGDANMWKDSVEKSLLDAGHGILIYNMRGQRDSPFSPGTTLDQKLIVSDAVELLDYLKPPNPVFVGLSIGGIFAAWAVHQGAACAGIVFLNTLRQDGPRLKWINDAVVRLAELGDGELLRDILSPLIMNEDWQADNRNSCLAQNSYSPMDKDSGAYNLLSSARSTDWDFPYQQLSMPTLIVTGNHDRVFRDPEVIEQIVARLPNTRRIDIPNAGHMIPVERPGILADALLDMANWVAEEG